MTEIKAATEPKLNLVREFSSPHAAPTRWTRARKELEQAEVFWLSTMRPDGQPHVTPLIAVLVDDALHFCTGAHERKAKNLAANAACTITTGCNSIGGGLDVVVEGRAMNVRDDAELRPIADAYRAKYGSDWDFEVRDGGFHHSEGGADHQALVFRVVPAKAFAFAKGDPFSQTRYLF